MHPSKADRSAFGLGESPPKFDVRIESALHRDSDQITDMKLRLHRGHQATSRKASSNAPSLYFVATSPENKRLVGMKPSDQDRKLPEEYRKFAEECRRLAPLAKTDEQRKVLLEMEAVWTKLAEEGEKRTAKSKVS